MKTEAVSQDIGKVSNLKVGVRELCFPFVHSGGISLHTFSPLGKVS